MEGRRLLALLGITALVVGGAAALAGADTLGPEGFEGFTTGSPNGQFGWQKTGPYDVEVVANTYGYASFATQSLRISNAVTSSSFGDHTFSASLADEAGEWNAANGGLSGGTRQSHFEASWMFASTVPGAEQSGLSAVASPDRGDGARMSWIQMLDTPTGLEVNFYDYQDAAPYGSQSSPTDGYGPEDDFVFTTVATGLDRTVPHEIDVSMDFVNGQHNDIVTVCVDGVFCHTGTSWEDYFRFVQGPGGPEWDGVTGFSSRTVDSILFRTGGAAAPATSGYGFLVDGFELVSSTPPPAHVEGTWSSYPEQSVAAYQSMVRPPINANGTSNFPKKRGAIPIQFDLLAAKGPLVLTSDTEVADTPDDDYGYLVFYPSTELTFGDIGVLQLDYTFLTGNCHAGSIRWQLGIDTDGDGSGDGNMFIHFGPPSFTDCTGANDYSGLNFFQENSVGRYDIGQLGGSGYTNYETALALLGDANVTYVAAMVDSGWAGTQVVQIDGATVNDAVFTPEPDGVFEPTCDLPEARIKWTKTDPYPTGAVNDDLVSVQIKDTGEFYRVVDCRYMYNLDVSSLGDLATRVGTYYVYVEVDGTLVETSPARFDLR